MIDFRTSLGKGIDITIIILNLLLVTIFVIDTYNISSSLRDLLWKLEILIVGIFIVEYLLRLYGAPNRLSYVRDIYSIIDLVAIMPTLILLALPPSFFIYDIRVIQTLRVLMVFRIFRFLRFISQNHLLFGMISQGMINVARLVVSIIIIFFVYSGLFYFVDKGVNDAISLKFLDRKAACFMGSTKIAYGPSEPPSTEADLLVLKFYERIKEGLTFGEAFMKAKQDFARESIAARSRLDRTEEKTLIEFVMFADPSSKMEEE